MAPYPSDTAPPADVAPVAQLILATQDSEGDQEMGATVITTPLMAAVRPADDGGGS